MPKKKNNNRKRKFPSSQIETTETTTDLFVPLPSKPPVALQIRSIADRLLSIGYQTMALTHTIYGAPQEHAASDVLPDSLIPNNTTLTSKRRLHAIVESVSEVAAFQNKSYLQKYSLVSIAPRNQATFRQACTASHVDIITLDYASVRGGLPYSIASADVRAVFARGAVLEIPYAAAVLQPSLRAPWIQMCREVQLACLGISRPQLLLSSGPTGTTAEDNPREAVGGELALHSYTDVLHMITTVTGLKEAWFRGASETALRHGERRMAGFQPRLMEIVAKRDLTRSSSADISSLPTSQFKQLKAEEDDVLASDKTTKIMEPRQDESMTEQAAPLEKEPVEGGDGFISF